jgi:hypothetical protein
MSRIKRVRRLALKYPVVVLLLAAAALAQTYTTHFPLTEDPISESGAWINGGAVGLDWTNVRTTPGFAFGTMPGTAGSPSFADSWALLNGTWGPDQTAQATINAPSTNDSCNQEIELVLRGNLSAHVATGYEITVKAANDSSSYLVIVRWNGAYGDFTYLVHNLVGPAYGVKTGDVFEATIVGNVITAYINGVQKAQVTDDIFATGLPGMGFYLGHTNSAICAGTNAGYGFANYTAVAIGNSPTFVQVNSGPSTIQASNSSVAVSYLNPQTAGNLNLVAVGWGDTTSSISSITDTRGNTYTPAVGPTKGTGLQQSVYYAKNIVGGSNTVTVKFNQAAAYPDVRIVEYSGLDPTSPLDVTKAGTGTGPAANSGSATTTSSNELIFGAGTSAHHFTAAGSGFASRVINIYGSIAEDEVVSSSGSYSATATNSAGAWVMQMATFRSPNLAPAVTAISPTSGSANGGTAITITGTGFLPGASVKLGGTVATGVTVVSSTSITATTPAHAAGPVSVVVTNSDGESGTLAESYTYTSASAVITFVQVNSGPSTIQASNSSVAVSYLNPQTAGNLNLVAVGWGDTTSSISSITDTRGNTYTPAVGPTKGTGLQQSVYYAKNIVGGSNTVTVKFNQAAAYPDVRIVEYSGLDPTSPLDVTKAGTGTGPAANSGSATTTSSNELIFGAGTSAHHFTAAGSGFASRVINIYGSIAEDEVVGSSGSYSATATNSAGAWVMQMATFKANSSP